MNATASKTAPVTPVNFIDTDEFKTLIGKTGAKGEIIDNPKTGKTFVSIGGLVFKCQGDIDLTQPKKFLVEGTDYSNACLVNVAQVNVRDTF